jgi:DNA gyrase/topoisomerase IV subunit A
MSCASPSSHDIVLQVAQLVGYISEHAAYHHGEQSLTMTIVNLARDYVGSNNLNLLLPNGQYGMCDQGVKDHASARYIFIEPAPITCMIFHPADDPLLDYLKEDNDQIEPEWYMPVIPLVLINGRRHRHRFVPYSELLSALVICHLKCRLEHVDPKKNAVPPG